MLLKAGGKTQVEIADKLGVLQSCISKVLKRSSESLVVKRQRRMNAITQGNDFTIRCVGMNKFILNISKLDIKQEYKINQSSYLKIVELLLTMESYNKYKH